MKHKHNQYTPTLAQVNAGLMRLMASPTLPGDERLHRIVGLVHHVVCDVDPDSDTKNTFRSGRSNNVQRMKVFQRLQGVARRGLCQRAAQLGANAVLSFAIHFDLEDKMIVARASGSAVMCKRVLHEDDTNSSISSSPSSPRVKAHGGGSRCVSLAALLLLDSWYDTRLTLRQPQHHANCTRAHHRRCLRPQTSVHYRAGTATSAASPPHPPPP